MKNTLQDFLRVIGLTKKEIPKGVSLSDKQTLTKIENLIVNNRGKPAKTTPLHKVRFVVLDTETTGMDPYNGDEIISIGAVVIQDGKVLTDKVFDSLVNPGRAIPENIVELTGITEEMVNGAEDIIPVLVKLLQFVDVGIIVGHWIHFDLAFINLKLQQSCNIKFCPHTYDTNIISKAINPKVRSHTLDNLLKWYGISPVDRHTALGDALLTAQVFQKFLTYIVSNEANTLGDLDAFIKYNFNRYHYFAFPYF